MSPIDERKLVQAAQRASEALVRLAKVFEERLSATGFSPLVAAALAAAELPLGEVVEAAAKLRMKVKEHLLVSADVVVEVSEEAWPKLLEALRSTPEWESRGGSGDRPCEVELGGITFRARLTF